MGRGSASASGRSGGQSQGRPRLAAKASGVSYVKSPADAGHVLVDVRADKLDRAWSKDKNSYIGKRGAGAIGDRREQFREFLKDSKNGAIKPIVAPTVNVGKNGPAFVDGRHRFSVLRDQGRKRVVISVPRHQAAQTRRRFG